MQTEKISTDSTIESTINELLSKNASHAWLTTACITCEIKIINLIYFFKQRQYFVGDKLLCRYFILQSRFLLKKTPKQYKVYQRNLKTDYRRDIFARKNCLPTIVLTRVDFIDHHVFPNNDLYFRMASSFLSVFE